MHSVRGEPFTRLIGSLVDVQQIASNCNFFPLLPFENQLNYQVLHRIESGLFFCVIISMNVLSSVCCYWFCLPAIISFIQINGVFIFIFSHLVQFNIDNITNQLRLIPTNKTKWYTLLCSDNNTSITVKWHTHILNRKYRNKWINIRQIANSSLGLWKIQTIVYFWMEIHNFKLEFAICLFTILSV